MTSKEAKELLDSKEAEWKREWLIQAGSYESAAAGPGQHQAALCEQYLREMVQKELQHNPDVMEAVRTLESARDEAQNYTLLKRLSELPPDPYLRLFGRIDG